VTAVEVRFLPLADAEPDEAVVVVDVLRAFTTVPWLHHRGVARVLAVDTPERAIALRDHHLPDALLAGESGGRPLPGFDLGNSPTEVAATDLPLEGGTVVHRTSAGTQGLVRCAGSGVLFAASFVNASATAGALRSLGPHRVSFVVTGASLGRDGDEDLAAAELIGALTRGERPDPAPYLARVGPSDAGRNFTHDGPDWAPPSDLAAACDLDRFDTALRATPAAVPTADGDTPVVELTSG
jgi:2-phosphosulfolactate phosphatase